MINRTPFAPRLASRCLWLSALGFWVLTAACRGSEPNRFDESNWAGSTSAPRSANREPRASIEQKFYFGTDQLRYRREVLIKPGGTVLRHGKIAAWFPDGVQEYERFFENDEPVGLWKSWYRSGSPRSEVFCDNETKGQTTWWYENGQMTSQGLSSGGLKQGPWKHWYENGTVSAAGNYARGKRVGEWHLWNEFGEPSATGRYENGVRVGRWEIWNSEGTAVTRGSDEEL